MRDGWPPFFLAQLIAEFLPLLEESDGFDIDSDTHMNKERVKMGMKRMRMLVVLSVGVLMMVMASCSIGIDPIGPPWTVELTNFRAAPAQIWVGTAIDPGALMAEVAAKEGLFSPAGFQSVSGIPDGAFLRVLCQGEWVPFGIGGPTAYAIHNNWSFILPSDKNWISSER